jgi:SynChlorMet cassette protein ScmC
MHGVLSNRQQRHVGGDLLVQRGQLGDMVLLVRRECHGGVHEHRRGQLRVLLMDTHLCLKDGKVWAFGASGPAEPWLKEFSAAMGLSGGVDDPVRRILFEGVTANHGESLDPLPEECLSALQAAGWRVRRLTEAVFYEHRARKTILCRMHPAASWRDRVEQMRSALIPLYSDAVLAGGLPVHGGLVELDGAGTILAGHSGAGKSTACRRLPSPWRVLGDDLCLVVRRGPGDYLAHPLPTWSEVNRDDAKGRTRTAESVPLRAVFFLEQSRADGCLPLRKGAAAVSLAASALQVLRSLRYDFRAEGSRVNRGLYENAASIALTLPSWRLRASLTGRFWEEMERALMSAACEGSEGQGLPAAPSAFPGSEGAGRASCQQ